MPRVRTSAASRSLTAVALLLLSIALIGVSPGVLGAFPGGRDNWERLSFIGQTYGAATAVVSAAALIGVVGTLAYQAREVKRARDETRRQAISDLLRMAWHDPELDECWGPVPEDHDAKTRKQQLYTNMVIAEWEMSFETKALPERRLRAIASEMFEGRVGRQYWTTARDLRLSTSANRMERRFHEILDEEYWRTRPIGATAQNVPIHKPGPARVETPKLWVAIGVVTAVIGYRVLRRRHSARER